LGGHAASSCDKAAPETERKVQAAMVHAGLLN
jgi:hypothetical protein